MRRLSTAWHPLLARGNVAAVGKSESNPRFYHRRSHFLPDFPSPLLMPLRPRTAQCTLETRSKWIGNQLEKGSKLVRSGLETNSKRVQSGFKAGSSDAVQVCKY
jgi:hypothetical protein